MGGRPGLSDEAIERLFQPNRSTASQPAEQPRPRGEYPGEELARLEEPGQGGQVVGWAQVRSDPVEGCQERIGVERVARQGGDLGGQLPQRGQLLRSALRVRKAEGQELLRGGERHLNLSNHGPLGKTAFFLFYGTSRK